MLKLKNFLKLAHESQRVQTSGLAGYKGAKAARAKQHIEANVKDKRKIKLADKKLTMPAVDVKSAVSVQELADLVNRPVASISECMRLIMNRPDATFDVKYVIKNFSLIKQTIEMCGYRARVATDTDAENRKADDLLKMLDDNDDCIAKRARPTRAQLVPRAPIVTIMGHVDHGKTTLLDSLRHTNVAQTESGFITQHIGAFNTKFGDTKNVTFLDTPGHAAFMSMRERGAKLTDIIVLVIACDDGIMEQTVESIRLAQESKCEIMIALNKVDKIHHDPVRIRKIKENLLQYNIQTEDLGGDVQVVEISALKKTNLDLLLDKLWTLAELLELKGDPAGLVESYVVESYQDAQRGKLATVIVKRGKLRRGAYLVSGTSYCKVKQLFDDRMGVVNEADVSQAVLVMGWKDSVPLVGDECIEIRTEAEAKSLVENRLKRLELNRQSKDQIEINKKANDHRTKYKEHLEEKRKAGLRRLFKPRTNVPNEKEDNSGVKTLPIIIKSDVNGTLEAILNIMDTYTAHDKVKLDLIHFDIGQLTQNDIELAETFNAIIYCFNVRADPASPLNKDKKVQIKYFNIIYKLFDDLKEELMRLTPYIEEEHVVGEASVSQTFQIDEKKTSVLVCGGTCTHGSLDSRKMFKLLRPELHDTQTLDVCLSNEEKCRTLKHFKQDVQTIKKGSDFGIAFQNQSLSVRKGDKIVCYEKRLVQNPIEWDLGF